MLGIVAQNPSLSLNAGPVLDSTFLLVILLLPIVYCSILSLTVFPKRIISPFNIQLGTFAVNAIIVVDLFLRLYSGYMSPAGSWVIVGTLAFYGLAAGFFQCLLGFFQTVFVRWFVGLNIGNLVAQTYTVTTDFQTMRKTLLGKTFRSSVWNFRVEADDKDTLVMREQGRMVLVVRKSESGTILSVVPYDEGLYAIETSSGANDLAQSMVNDLRCRLPNTPEFKKPDVSTPALDAVSGIARMYARKRGQSKVAATRDIWKRLPHYLRYAIVATIIAYAILTIIFLFQRQLNVTIEIGTYLDLFGYFFLVFVGELGLAGWQEIRRSRRKDKEKPE